MFGRPKRKLTDNIKLVLRELDCGDDWSRTEHRFRVVQNKVMRRIFGPKAKEVPGS
jgi:hypothetical protein